MPWKTDEDVAKHKKGLNPKKSAQWRRIANSVLKAEMKKGKSEEEAAASAIRQANGVVNANSSYSIYKNKPTIDYEVKLAVHQEKPHLIVPVVMIVEGVLHGNQGPLLHLADEFGRVPDAWNGIPVVIDHPEKDGNAVSANSPEIIDSRTVGRVYNTALSGNKLKSEVWLDEDKLNEISPGTLEEINDRKAIEVSVGVFTDNEDADGTWNGKDYVQIAHNHRPDHLAILPNAVGACSCADGCGLGANENNDDMEANVMAKLLVLKGFGLTRISKYEDPEDTTEVEDDADEVGYNVLMNAICQTLNNMGSEGKWFYLEDCYDDYLIYSESGMKNDNKMYKQGYEFKSGKVELTGTPVEVHKKVEYVVNRGLTRNKFNINLKKEDNMANECAPCKQKIESLIANSQGRWTETDREFLQTLKEDQLDKLVPIEKVVEKVIEKEVQVNVLSDEDKAALATYKAEQKAKRDLMVKEIQANTSVETWPDELLNAMNDDVLKRLHGSTKKVEVADYSLNGAGVPLNVNTGIAPMLPTGLELEIAK
jgi:hypothetical protein